jgi:hypothetical protein
VHGPFPTNIYIKDSTKELHGSMWLTCASFKEAMLLAVLSVAVAHLKTEHRTDGHFLSTYQLQRNVSYPYEQEGCCVRFGEMDICNVAILFLLSAVACWAAAWRVHA